MAIERATLLIRCTREEAEAIRHAAKREHRTISGYVLNAVMYRLAREGQLPQGEGHHQTRKCSRPAGW